MEAIQNQQQIVELATNPVTNAATGLTGMWVFMSDKAPTIVALLTACVLACQLVAWGYKFYQWLRS